MAVLVIGQMNRHGLGEGGEATLCNWASYRSVAKRLGQRCNGELASAQRDAAGPLCSQPLSMRVKAGANRKTASPSRWESPSMAVTPPQLKSTTR